MLTRKGLQQYRPSKKFIIVGGIVLAGLSLAAEIRYSHSPLRTVPPHVVVSEQDAPPGAVCTTDVASRTRGFPFLIGAYTRSGCDSASAVYPVGIFLNIISSFLVVYIAGLVGNRYLSGSITKTNKP